MLKILKYLKHYVLQTIAVVLFVSVQAVLDFFLVDQTAEIVNLVRLGEEAISQIVKLGGIALAYAGAIMLSSIFVSFFSARISMGLGQRLRKTVYEKVESFSLAEFDKFSTSSLITRTTNDITQITNVLVMMLRFMILAPIMLIWGIVNSFKYSVSMTFVIIAAIPVLVVLIVVVLKYALPLFANMQTKLDSLTKISREGLTGVRVIRAFNNDDVQTRAFEKANADVTQNAIKVNKLMAVLMPIMSLLFAMLIIVLYSVAAVTAESAQTIANTYAVGQYSFRIMSAFMMLAMIFILMPRASAAAKRVNEILQTKNSLVDKADSDDVANTDNSGITFDCVSFYFDNAEEPSLMDLDFVAPRGKTTAIIGGTGSGKSTILNLIVRFYDTTRGKVLLDGVSVSDYSQQSLRSKIGLVPQTAVLFSGTIKENLRVGRPDATDQEIIDACKIARAHDFVSAMADGYDSLISQGGTNLSGGQKQRLCIARALVRKPEIYIFDDSFSALDFRTDAMIRANLKQVTHNSTVIIVAQRISTIMNADQIIYLKNGQIAGKGTHKQLLKQCPDYYELANAQLKQEELEL